MTLILSQSDFDELYQQAPKPQLHNLVLDSFETLSIVPERLGRGYTRSMELSPGVYLDLLHEEFYQDWMTKAPIREHSVEYSVWLSGLIHSEDVYPTLGGKRSYLTGSGIAPASTPRHERSQPLVGVRIHLSSDVFEDFFSRLPDANTSLLKIFVKQNDWKVSFFPPVTLAMQQVVQQMLNSPFCGVTRRLDLYAKVFDLLELQLEPIVADQRLSQSLTRCRLENIARIYHAKEVLTSQMENPPLLMELAQQLGMSDRTLRRGFRDVFGTTVVGYLTQQRMKLAEQLLREGNCTVAEVANRVGYAHLSHFAAGFKRQFGISPKECLSGRKIKVAKS